MLSSGGLCPSRGPEAPCGLAKLYASPLRARHRAARQQAHWLADHHVAGFLSLDAGDQRIHGRTAEFGQLPSVPSGSSRRASTSAPTCWSRAWCCAATVPRSLSAMQFQKLIRLQEARSNPDDIAAVGHSLGYDSPSQFSREYRRQFGVPPGKDALRLRSENDAELAPSLP